MNWHGCDAVDIAGKSQSETLSVDRSLALLCFDVYEALATSREGGPARRAFYLILLLVDVKLRFCHPGCTVVTHEPRVRLESIRVPRHRPAPFVVVAAAAVDVAQDSFP